MKKRFNMSGYLVETKTGIKGRTYHMKGLINGKVAVYVYLESEKPFNFHEKPILCIPDSLKIIGFVD